MQINRLSDLLKDVKLSEHKPASPPKKTPLPIKSKVVGIPTRAPVNKQAALAIAPNKSWITQPLPPEKLKTPQDTEIERLKAELKIERNLHAATTDELGASRQRVKALGKILLLREQEICQLRKTISENNEIIRQLEDLKL